jgi:hypothetical protein
MPVLAGPAHADRTAVLGHIRNDDDLRGARHAPSFAEDVEFDLAEAAGEGDLLRRRDALIAEGNDAVIVPGPLDRGEAVVVDGSRQIDTADLGAERSADRQMGIGGSVPTGPNAEVRIQAAVLRRPAM